MNEKPEKISPIALLSSHTREISLKLAARGWYLGWHNMPLSEMYKPAQAFNRGDFQAVDSFMASYIKHFLDEIKQLAIEEAPTRWSVLSSAFEAHSRGDYNCAIPVFLAQADGMTVDMLGTKFFKKENKIPSTANKIGYLVYDELSDAVLEPLRRGGALSDGDDMARMNPDILNRHRVLHGLCCDYGTEVNSLRAISLIQYLCATIPFLEKMTKITPEQVDQVKRALKEGLGKS